jgi:hypothetical protein
MHVAPAALARDTSTVTDASLEVMLGFFTPVKRSLPIREPKAEGQDRNTHNFNAVAGEDVFETRSGAYNCVGTGDRVVLLPAGITNRRNVCF